MFYLQPEILDFDQNTFDTICNCVIKQLHVAATLANDVTVDQALVAPATQTQTSSKKPIFYHADRWSLDLKENTFTRVHMFVPLGTKDMPAELGRFAEQRMTVPYPTLVNKTSHLALKERTLFLFLLTQPMSNCGQIRNCY